MNKARKRKLYGILLLCFCTSIAIACVLFALKQNINLFYTPSQIISGEAPPAHTIRVGGMVEKNSVHRDVRSLAVSFVLTDFHHRVTVNFNGILPDLFREGQGVVAQGVLNPRGVFEAKEVLAKHDENYMPPNVMLDKKIHERR